jgi:hypothetical protein
MQSEIVSPPLWTNKSGKGYAAALREDERYPSGPIVPGLWEKEESAKRGSTYFVAYNQLFKNPAKVTRNGSHER